MNKKLFDILVYQWEEDTKYISSTTQIFNHPNYKLIIEEGEKVLPFIIEEMKSGKCFWINAVESILNKKIIPVEIYGRMELMRLHMLNWLIEHGYA